MECLWYPYPVTPIGIPIIARRRKVAKIDKFGSCLLYTSKEHLWEPNRNWGYVQFSTSKEATDEYLKYANMLKNMIARGFSAAVYTQTTDVEIEVNGLMTYDRKEMCIRDRLTRAVIHVCKWLSLPLTHNTMVLLLE